MNLTIRKATCADAENYICVLTFIKSRMTESQWFYIDPPEYIRQSLSDGTMELWLAEDGDRIAGAFHIIHPGLHPDNYGYELSFTEAELLRVIHMDSAAVHPDYRGRKLQQKLMAIIEEDLKKRFPGAILLTTVHPENLYSLYNVQSMGYTPVLRLAKYGSERYILRKDIP